jgi:hypothetical protein
VPAGRGGRGKGMCWVGTGEDSPGLDGVAEDREMWLGGRWDRNGEAIGCSYCHPHGKAADIVVRLAWYGGTSTADHLRDQHTKWYSVHPNRPSRSLPLPSPLVITGGGLHLLTVPLLSPVDCCNTQHTHTFRCHIRPTAATSSHTSAQAVFAPVRLDSSGTTL